ncbi:MAG: hypothetical protein HY746_09115 [Elusimicrobia bacterium]|nr:hypothetical protein [Elusimicrobiota bacterium]
MNKKMFYLFPPAVLGFAAVILPVILRHQIFPYRDTLFPVLRSGVEKLSLLSVIGLFLAGLLAGIKSPFRPSVNGLLTMSLFPVIAIADMIFYPTSHNLWPLEFVVYLLLTIPGIIGAYTGRFLGGKIFKE